MMQALATAYALIGILVGGFAIYCYGNHNGVRFTAMQTLGVLVVAMFFWPHALYSALRDIYWPPK